VTGTAYSGKYLGRFAPSPTGPLHAGSLVAALASWLQARAHDGQWLIRIEDVDTPRCIPGVEAIILNQLAVCGLHSDGPILRQSDRSAQYQAALDHLVAQGLAYSCACSRKEIEAAQTRSLTRHSAAVYPGTCRQGLNGKAARAWRLNVGAVIDTFNLPVLTTWNDALSGQQTQNVATAVGDFVLLRADGLWAYQMAVVLDDAAQGISHVVRGADLSDNTPRQIMLQKALGLVTPQYRHTPLVMAADGEKLSKQNGALALDLSNPLAALNAAAGVLGLPSQSGSLACALAHWVQLTRQA